MSTTLERLKELPDKGLRQVVSEWRDDAANLSRMAIEQAAGGAPHSSLINDGESLGKKNCADELQPFLERLEDILKDCEDRLAFREKMGTGSKTDLYRIRQELHSILHGEQQEKS